MRANREAFERRRIVPRVLRDVSVRDTSVELFGRRLESPLLLCPIGVLEMAHADADLAVARAAAAERVPMIFSNQASVSMEACAKVMGDAPRWFQLYWNTSNDVVASFVARAEAAGCEAIVLTLDTTLLAWRPRDLDLGYLPVPAGQGDRPVHQRPRFHRREHRRRAARIHREAEPRCAAHVLGAVARVSGSHARQPALAAAAGGGTALLDDVLATVAQLGRPRLPTRADAAADPAQGRPPPGRRSARARARHGRNRRLQPRRPSGGRCDRNARRAPRDRGRGRRPRARAARQRDPRRSRHLQGAGARRDGGLPRPARTSTGSRRAARRASAR